MPNIENNRALLKEQITRLKTELTNVTIQKEHHGDDWSDELLSMSISDFLDKVRELDADKYDIIEAIIDSMSENF
jgi:hypothetical protein